MTVDLSQHKFLVEKLKQPTFDPKCKELALHFLMDCHYEIDNQGLNMDVLIKQLAIEIQRTVEDFISNRFEGKV
jgi:hypothetical protein